MTYGAIGFAAVRTVGHLSRTPWTYLARRYTLSVLSPVAEIATNFNSSPARLTETFASVPSTFGIRAASYRWVRVLSDSLTVQVPKLPTNARDRKSVV